MTNNTKTPTTFRLYKTPILFLISCPIVFLITGQIAKNNTIDPVTIISLIIMITVFFVESFFARKKLLWIIADLKNTTNRIKSGSNFVYVEDCFNHPILNEYMDQYIKEKRAADVNGTVRPDVANFINENVISGIIHREITDQISNAMTGLGILGTFIGLTMGLETFNSQDAINSTPELLNGIKVAFYTSIFGVLLSLVYGTLYKYRFNQAEAAVEEFVSLFYRYGGYRPENEAVSRLLQLQEEQTDSMNQFAEEISIALADALDKALAPTLNKCLRQSRQIFLPPCKQLVTRLTTWPVS